MKKGQVFVRGLKAAGKFGNIDALDLDDASFRAFVIGMLHRAGIVAGIKSEMMEGDEIKLKENKS